MEHGHGCRCRCTLKLQQRVRGDFEEQREQLQQHHAAVEQHSFARCGVDSVERHRRVERVLVHSEVGENVDQQAHQQRSEVKDFAKDGRDTEETPVLLHRVWLAQESSDERLIILLCSCVQQHRGNGGGGDGVNPNEGQSQPQAHLSEDDQVPDGVAHVDIALQRHARDGEEVGENAGCPHEVLDATPGAKRHGSALN